MKSNNLTPMECDALREVANIAGGNAATALSNILNKKIDIQIPDVKFCDVESAAGIVGNIEEIVVATYFGIEGNLTGSTLIVFNEKTTYRLVDLLMGTSGTKKLDDMSESAIKEVGNILLGSYLNAVADFLEIRIIPTVPHMSYDMLGSMLSQILSMHAEHSNQVLVSLTNLYLDTEKLEGHIIIMFDTKSMKKTIQLLNKKLGI